jgi:hypothetical protein
MMNGELGEQMAFGEGAGQESGNKKLRAEGKERMADSLWLK